jgi:hypothetical protein
MKINIYIDGIEYKEDNQDHIIIETFKPSNANEKQILIRSLIELINYFKVKF